MKKRVGILTFHRAINWGAMLQCYALYKTIEKLGYKVDVIDYRQPHFEHIYNYTRKLFHPVELKSILIKPWWWPGFLFKALPERRAARHTKLRLIESLSYSKKAISANEIPQKYDTIVVGSDQVWANYCTNGIDEVYYGEFPHTRTKVIGYAISSNIDSLKENGNVKLERLCKNFYSIAFREKEVSDYLQKNISLKSEVVLDPTLLLSKKEWDEITDITSNEEAQDYILTFFLNENFDKKILDKGISTLATTHKCKIIRLEETVNSPEKFISVIKHAKYIITSSFHVTVFSIIYNKKFLSLRTNNGKDIRYINLLEKIGLSSQLVEYYNINDADTWEINYEKVNQTLTKEIEKSLLYLTNNL